jgi:hypothetical protein
MKKFLIFTIGLAIAFLFIQASSIFSLSQIVPVTVAQSTSVQSTAPVEVKPFANSSDVAVGTAAPTPATLPTLAPVVMEQSFRATPDATIIAAESITEASLRADEQALLDQFIQAVSGSGTEEVTGVYISGRFSLPVLQQPTGDDGFVSTQDQTLTQFGLPNAYDTVGLLAHNNLSGKMFFDLHEGEEVVIVYGNGSLAKYRITQIERYQALSPTSEYSYFIDLSDPDPVKLTSAQVFQRVYTAGNRVVFQTCIAADGNLSWGRIFVIAEKISQ